VNSQKGNAVKIVMMIMFGGVVGSIAQAQAETDARLSTVRVYVRSGFGDPNVRLPCAENLASAIFAKAGVNIEWRIGQLKPDPKSLAVLIDVTLNTPGTFILVPWRTPCPSKASTSESSGIA
jgi:hypothetical protein